jgi:hypothetical protein
LTDTPDTAALVRQLADGDDRVRQAAALELYRLGADRAQAAVRAWAGDKELARLIAGPPTVGIAVTPQHFAAIHAAWAGTEGPPRLAQVPADQDAREFELHIEFDGATALLDILTPRDPSDPNSQGSQGAIARFLAKQGEGVQQVEFPCKDVTRAAELIRERFGVPPAYPETREGAEGTRVNFFLVALPDGTRVLIELFERAARSSD